MEELIKSIETKIDEYKKHLADYAKGSKAAGARARKTTKELEKMFKEFRKQSIELGKQK